MTFASFASSSQQALEIALMAGEVNVAPVVVAADRLLTRDQDFNKIGLPGLVAVTPAELISET